MKRLFFQFSSPYALELRPSLWPEFGLWEEIPEKKIGEEDGEDGPRYPVAASEGWPQEEERQHG